MNANPSPNPCDFTIVEAASRLRARQLSCVELLESVLARAKSTEPVVHAYVELFEEDSRREAQACDDELAKGSTRGPLHGIPLGIKDIFDVAASQTRCGSRARAEVPPAARDAAPVHLLREAGAILIGKTVTQEFAAGVVSEPARNPWDTERIPGGSSGGTAAAIAVSSALAGMGSDTGGSIRIPAAVCGVVGLKPTYGTVSTEGVFPLSWSLDTAGPLAKSVDDAALLFQVIRDSDRQAIPARRNESVRIGVPRRHFFERLQPGVGRAVEAAIEQMTAAGLTIVEVDWEQAGMARACSFIINRVETAGVHRQFLVSHGELYGDELRRRIESNALFPATGYLRALQARGLIQQSVARLFSEHRLDALVTPSTPGTAAKAVHTFVAYPDGTEEHVSMAYTRLSMPFNVTGQPVLSIPCGFDELGLPVGLQIAGRPYSEAALCSIGRRVEDVIGLQRTLPPIARVAA